MTVTAAPLCLVCTRYREDAADVWTCDAFPRGIPQEIITWKHDHRQPFRGDGGKLFEAKDGVDDVEKELGLK